MENTMFDNQKLNVFFEARNFLCEVDFSKPTTSFEVALQPYFPNLTKPQLREYLEIFKVMQPVLYNPRASARHRLADHPIQDFIPLKISSTLSDHFSGGFIDQHIHLVVRGGGPLEMNVFLRKSKKVRSVAVQLTAKIQDINISMGSTISIKSRSSEGNFDAFFKVMEPVEVTPDEDYLNIPPKICQRVAKTSTIEQLFPTVFSLQHVQLVIHD